MAKRVVLIEGPSTDGNSDKGRGAIPAMRR